MTTAITGVIAERLNVKHMNLCDSGLYNMLMLGANLSQETTRVVPCAKSRDRVVPNISS